MKLWEDWRLRHQDVRRRETEYVTDAQACKSIHQSRSQMRPFRIRNMDGLSNLYTRDLYRYQPSPRSHIPIESSSWIDLS